ILIKEQPRTAGHCSHLIEKEQRPAGHCSPGARLVLTAHSGDNSGTSRKSRSIALPDTMMKEASMKTKSTVYENGKTLQPDSSSTGGRLGPCESEVEREPGALKSSSNVLEAIGRTPLIALRRLAQGVPARVFVKLEAANPGGSIKDRVGVAMVEEAE